VDAGSVGLCRFIEEDFALVSYLRADVTCVFLHVGLSFDDMRLKCIIVLTFLWVAAKGV